MKYLKICAIILSITAIFMAVPARATQSPSISLSPGTGVPGVSVTVKGANFGNSETVDVTFDGSLVGKAGTNNKGSFSLSFIVSKSLAPGAYQVKAVGEKSGLTAQTAFTVKDPTAITLNPAIGPTNTSVFVTGSLFGSKETVNLYFDAVQVAFATTNSTGAFTQTFLVPAAAAVGVHTVNAVGQKSGYTAQASFQVTAPAAPAVSDNPNLGPPTTQTAVNGANFGKNEVVDIYFDTTDLVLASTNSSGAFTQNLQVPVAAAPGQHWITAVGRASGLSAQIPFTVRTDWAQYRYGPRHSGYNPFENVLNASNIAGLGQAWTGSTGNSIQSSPAVANGVAYVGSNDNKLYAFDAITGQTPAGWTNPTTGGEITSSPAVANGVVYVGSLDGKLYAFDAITGLTPAGWTNPTTDNTPIRSSPAVANGVVYVGSFGFGSGSFGGKLYAFNANSGATLWSVNTGDNILSSPAVANGVVYLGSFDGNLYAFNASNNGAFLWNYQTGGGISSSPAVANGVVYVGSTNGDLFAINAATGAKIWSAVTGGGIGSSPAVANGVVYVGSGDNNLYAFDANSGAHIWTAATGNAIFSSPAVANGVVYVGSEDDKLYAFDAARGIQLWSAATGNMIDSSPAVANGMVYVGSEDGKLYTYNLAAGGAAFSPLTATTATATSGATLAAPGGPPNPASLKPDNSLKLD